ncbi:MAG: hypothetical protein HOY69_18965 [Streptomyces sp.]|nr:hypothetical protein [Streptomyces sp.]
MTEPTADFFQPGHTYQREHHGGTIRFLVEYVSTSPDGASQAAHGWRTRSWDPGWEPTDSDDFTGWIDAAPAVSAGVAPETDEQRADREETERDHARGDHTYCGITCEVELPTEHLRNFILAKGYPGTAGALDELLRRAAVVLPAPAAEESPS